MICERVKEQLPEYLSGALAEPARARLLAHFDSCAECRAEVAELGTVWRAIELLPSAEPSAAMRPRFDAVLAAYQAGMHSARAVPAPRMRLSGNWAWLAAAAAGGILFAAGLAAGGLLTTSGITPRNTPRNPEISQLQHEVEQMRQLVTLSLLDQQSPSARLRGVTYSYRMEHADPQVETALLHAVMQDPNVNVRLSALDALQKYAASPSIARALVDALPVQDSPLVQIGLIDLLCTQNIADAAPALRKLTRDESANPAVRQRAQWGLNRLGAI